MTMQHLTVQQHYLMEALLEKGPTTIRDFAEEEEKRLGRKVPRASVRNWFEGLCAKGWLLKIEGPAGRKPGRAANVYFPMPGSKRMWEWREQLLQEQHRRLHAEQDELLA
jgi:hypothetical protein